MTGVIAVHVNCTSQEEAQAVARAALAQRLAASANIHAPITSLYRWQGAVETGPEVPLVLKTRTELFDALARLVAEMHSYETPAILGFPAMHASTAYAAWVRTETEPPK